MLKYSHANISDEEKTGTVCSVMQYTVYCIQYRMFKPVAMLKYSHANISDEEKTGAVYGVRQRYVVYMIDEFYRGKMTLCQIIGKNVFYAGRSGDWMFYRGKTTLKWDETLTGLE